VATGTGLTPFTAIPAGGRYISNYGVSENRIGRVKIIACRASRRGNGAF
jgi:hypothetical protein